MDSLDLQGFPARVGKSVRHEMRHDRAQKTPAGRRSAGNDPARIGSGPCDSVWAIAYDRVALLRSGRVRLLTKALWRPVIHVVVNRPAAACRPHVKMDENQHGVDAPQMDGNRQPAKYERDRYLLPPRGKQKHQPRRKRRPCKSDQQEASESRPGHHIAWLRSAPVCTGEGARRGGYARGLPNTDWCNPPDKPRHGPRRMDATRNGRAPPFRPGI